MKNMKSKLCIKLSGERDAIQNVLNLLETSYDVIATSDFLQNVTVGCHIYCDLEEKR